MQTATTQQAKPAKRIKYPHFVVTALIDAFEQGEMGPTITVRASCYISFKDEAHRLLVRDAKYRLEMAGVPKERIEALYFDENDLLTLTAYNPKGVRRVDNEPIEAFFDSRELKKRDALIRQHRLCPYDQADMLAIYGPKNPGVAVEGCAA